jgi:hypothetical protein
MLCQHSFGELADLHRSRGSDITMLLVSAPTEESEKKGDQESLMWLRTHYRHICYCCNGAD